MTDLTTRTRAGLKWSYLATLAQALVSLLILTVLSRLLSPTDFGLFGIALIYVSLAEMATKFGIGPSVVQRLHLTHRHVEVAFALSVVLGVVMTAAGWLFAPLFGAFFDAPMMPQILRALSVTFAIAGCGSVPEHLLQRYFEFKRLTTINVLSYAVGYGLTAIVMACLEFGLWSLVWATIVRSTMHTLMVIRYSPLPLRPRLAVRDAADLLGFATGFSLTQILHWIAQQSSPFVIGRWLGASSLGYYTRAYSLVSPPLKLGFTLMTVLFPAMSERQQRRESLRVIYVHGIEMLSLVALPVVALVIVTAPDIVAVVLGRQWDAVVPIFQVLALIILFSTCEAMNPPLLRALGAVYGEARSQMIFALLMVIGSWFGSRWGLGGVAVATVGAWCAVHLLMTRLSLSFLDLSWRSVLRCHLPSLWVSVWAALALWLTVQQLRAVLLPVPALLVIELLVWIVTVVVAMYFAPPFARPLFVEWLVKGIRLDSMGKPGRYLGTGLVWLLEAGRNRIRGGCSEKRDNDKRRTECANTDPGSHSP